MQLAFSFALAVLPQGFCFVPKQEGEDWKWERYSTYSKQRVAAGPKE